jgi:hypothetical protein
VRNRRAPDNDRNRFRYCFQHIQELCSFILFPS